MKPSSTNGIAPRPAAGNLAAAQAQARFRQGLALHDQGQLAQAQQVYRQVLVLQPGHFDALHMLGVLAGQTGNSALAVDWIAKAIEANPASASAHSNLGNALSDLKQYRAAIESYDRAIAIKPDYANAYFNRGKALFELKQYQAAIDSYEKAIAIKPNHADAYCDRGVALNELKQHQAAIDSFKQAIAINPAHAKAYCNCGAALNELRQHQAAVDCFDKAVAIQPDYAEAYLNRGIALLKLKRHLAVIESYDKALAIAPDYAEVHWNQSLCYLQMGDFERGWVKYEWRWKNEKLGLNRFQRALQQPLWLGAESLQDKTILLYSEQGLGDTLQFCRYVSLVSGLGARVILQVQRPLLTLLRGLEGVAELVAIEDKLPAFDYHCPLLSLPLAFKTTLDTLPAFASYIAADPDTVARWRSRLGDRTRPRVGLVWSGNALHDDDSNRSIALSDFIELMPRGFQYLSLQKELRGADRETLGLHPEILHYGEELRDFSDTAALCELVDLVISVDTSVAHLAGALGKPVWIVLPFNPDWRWLLDRSDSPWYPTAKLYRQQAPGDWAGVLDRVAADLKRAFETA